MYHEQLELIALIRLSRFVKPLGDQLSFAFGEMVRKRDKVLRLINDAELNVFNKILAIH